MIDLTDINVHLFSVSLLRGESVDTRSNIVRAFIGKLDTRLLLERFRDYFRHSSEKVSPIVIPIYSIDLTF